MAEAVEAPEPPGSPQAPVLRDHGDDAKVLLYLPAEIRWARMFREVH
ncbi:MAG TPA: hypothetical protein VN785_03625 [Candidatus Angelobacter sp.]|nr:hypothetical protein [Candidatus Angelobacter sp.]